MSKVLQFTQFGVRVAVRVAISAAIIVCLTTAVPARSAFVVNVVTSTAALVVTVAFMVRKVELGKVSEAAFVIRKATFVADGPGAVPPAWTPTRTRSLYSAANF